MHEAHSTSAPPHAGTVHSVLHHSYRQSRRGRGETPLAHLLGVWPFGGADAKLLSGFAHPHAFPTDAAHVDAIYEVGGVMFHVQLECRAQGRHLNRFQRVTRLDERPGEHCPSLCVPERGLRFPYLYQLAQRGQELRAEGRFWRDLAPSTLRGFPSPLEPA